ncbi:hypothetical protein K438DRAFT_1948899 [Mycena galopus ATCC 62051]|nr:hypothetical protein K438DRAFT_1948899 [Mycena galopus ATCC 62051]
MAKGLDILDNAEHTTSGKRKKRSKGREGAETRRDVGDHCKCERDAALATPESRIFTTAFPIFPQSFAHAQGELASLVFTDTLLLLLGFADADAEERKIRHREGGRLTECSGDGRKQGSKEAWIRLEARWVDAWESLERVRCRRDGQGRVHAAWWLVPQNAGIEPNGVLFSLLRIVSNACMRKVNRKVVLEINRHWAKNWSRGLTDCSESGAQRRRRDDDVECKDSALAVSVPKSSVSQIRRWHVLGPRVPGDSCSHGASVTLLEGLRGKLVVEDSGSPVCSLGAFSAVLERAESWKKILAEVVVFGRFAGCQRRVERPIRAMLLLRDASGHGDVTLSCHSDVDLSVLTAYLRTSNFHLATRRRCRRAFSGESKIARWFGRPVSVPAPKTVGNITSASGRKASSTNKAKGIADGPIAGPSHSFLFATMLTPRRMPFCLKILPFRHSQITCSLRHISGSAQSADKKTRRKRERFAEPYRTKLDLGHFSCDWDKWNRIFLDVPPKWYDLTMMEFFVKRVAKVPGTIRPLAYLPDVDPCVAFEAAHKYYYLNTVSDYLESFGGDFDSHDDFLAAFTSYPPIKGAVHQFPDDTEELYATVWKEQERRAAKAAKAEMTLESQVSQFCTHGLGTSLPSH